MKYQKLINNQIVEIAQDEFNFLKECDERYFGKSIFYMPDIDVLTILPYQNIRFGIVSDYDLHQIKIREIDQIRKDIDASKMLDHYLTSSKNTKQYPITYIEETSEFTPEQMELIKNFKSERMKNEFTIKTVPDELVEQWKAQHGVIKTTDILFNQNQNLNVYPNLKNNHRNA